MHLLILSIKAKILPKIYLFELPNLIGKTNCIIQTLQSARVYLAKPQNKSLRKNMKKIIFYALFSGLLLMQGWVHGQDIEALKTKYDPANLFRLNQNIPPLTS